MIDTKMKEDEEEITNMDQQYYSIMQQHQGRGGLGGSLKPQQVYQMDLFHQTQLEADNLESPFLRRMYQVSKQVDTIAQSKEELLHLIMFCYHDGNQCPLLREALTNYCNLPDVDNRVIDYCQEYCTNHEKYCKGGEISLLTPEIQDAFIKGGNYFFQQVVEAYELGFPPIFLEYSRFLAKKLHQSSNALALIKEVYHHNDQDIIDEFGEDIIKKYEVD